MIKFTIFGIKFVVSVGFIGVLTLMLYIDRAGLMLPTITAITLHEAGHIAALMLLKAKPERVELKVGAVGISGSFVLSRSSEIVMFAAGSVLNIFLFFILYFLYYFSDIEILLTFSIVMLVIGLFNLLPIVGLDGGSILNAVLGAFLKAQTVGRIIFVLSIITVTLIIAFGICVLSDTKSNITLILMGLYLFLGILLSKKQKNDCKMPLNIVK